MGEVAVPFVAAANSCSFVKHHALSSEFRQASCHLIKKARMRGVRLLLPVDGVFGDAEISTADRMRCFDAVDPGSRDDGTDYEGDTTTVNLEAFRGSSVDGFMYDIGPESARALEEGARSASIVLCWGTAGVCEFASFQAGQRALVESVAAKEDGATKSPISLVIGVAAVEWFARMSDADGERTGGDGDIERAGIVSYAQRSSVLASILSLHNSVVLKATTRRASEHSEWCFNAPPPVNEEDDDN